MFRDLHYPDHHGKPASVASTKLGELWREINDIRMMDVPKYRHTRGNNDLFLGEVLQFRFFESGERVERVSDKAVPEWPTGSGWTKDGCKKEMVNWKTPSSWAEGVCHGNAGKAMMIRESGSSLDVYLDLKSRDSECIGRKAGEKQRECGE